MSCKHAGCASCTVQLQSACACQPGWVGWRPSCASPVAVPGGRRRQARPWQRASRNCLGLVMAARECRISSSKKHRTKRLQGHTVASGGIFPQSFSLAKRKGWAKALNFVTPAFWAPSDDLPAQKPESIRQARGCVYLEIFTFTDTCHCSQPHLPVQSTAGPVTTAAISACFWCSPLRSVKALSWLTSFFCSTFGSDFACQGAAGEHSMGKRPGTQTSSMLSVHACMLICRCCSFVVSCID
jgi:hypothetical protein